MATIQKTTLKRYNGTDWDPVYLANSADITYIGTGFEVASGDGFEKGESISASTSTYDLLKRVIEGLTAVTKDKLPALEAGTALTEVDASKLKGVISRDNLPSDVGGTGKEVASEEEKAALTKETIRVGDIVKVAGGKVYLVTGTDPMSYMELTDSASDIAWARVTGTPDSLAGYGIKDAVASSEKVTVASAENKGKILVLNADGKLDVDITGDAAKLGGQLPAYYAAKADQDTLAGRVTTNEGDITTLKKDIKAIDAAWITTGTIAIDRLPATVIERMYVADNAAALKDLTTEQVQNGDTVKLADTKQMYYVIADDKLGTDAYMDAFTEYTAGVASSVEWSGVLHHPTTIAGYGITDELLYASDVAATATAGKLLKLDATDGKLHADIVGDADTLDGKHATDFATAGDMTQAKTDITNINTNIKDLQEAVGIGGETGGNSMREDITDLQGRMTTAETDITNLKAGTAITALAASKLTGTVARANLPADIAGRLFEKATLAEAQGSLTKDTAAAGDLVKLTDGKLYMIVDANSLDSDAGYKLLVDVAGSTIQWSQLNGVPTSLAAMNWADAVTTAMLVDAATVANKGKLLKIGDDGKLNASITGDAMTLESHGAAYFATKEEHDAVAGRVTTAEGKVTTLETEIKAIDAAWITTGKISLDRLPHGALERCVVVADDDARFALTTDKVQNGDTVKVTGTGLMYFVVDEEKLGESAGYEVYTAGTASAVDWSGITNKPTTIAGYGITDKLVYASEKVTTATGNAGKILVLNDEGKLDVDITGSVAWGKITGAPKSTVDAIDAAVEAATHANRAVLDELGDTNGVLTYKGAAVATKAQLDQVALGALSVVDSAPTDATVGQLVLESIK